MKITTYGLVRVAYEGGRHIASRSWLRPGTFTPADGDHVRNGDIIIRGGVVPGGTAFIMLDIEYQDLTESVVAHIWRAVRDAGHVAIIGPMDASAALAGDLAWKDGQILDAGPTDADDAAAEFEAYNALLADIARFREEAGE